MSFVSVNKFVHIFTNPKRDGYKRKFKPLSKIFGTEKMDIYRQNVKLANV